MNRWKSGIRGAAALTFWAAKAWLLLAGGLLTLAVLLLVIVSETWRLRNADDHATPNAIWAANSAQSASAPRAQLNADHLPVTRPFIGIAMSGGGSRSANFALAVSQELDRLGVLAQAEVLSGISGGSMTAAYLASALTESPTPEFWKSAYAKLGQNFEDALIERSLRFSNIHRMLTTSYSRGDVWAGTLDDLLFENRRFGQLAHPGNAIPGMTPYRATLLISATSVNDPFLTADDGLQIDPRMANGYYMAPFTFTNERFRSMSSDLGDLPLSYAVASSSAFPGAINPVSLAVADFATGAVTSTENSKTAATPARTFAKRYIKLADGGLTDNLGIDAVRKLFEVRAGSQRDLDNVFKPRPCLIIAIDAASPAFDGPRNQALTRDGRSHWWSALVDSTVVEGYDAYLMRRRLDQLDELGIDPAGIEYRKLFKSRPTAVQQVELRSRFYQYRNNGSEIGANTVFSRSAAAQTVNGEAPVASMPKYACTVWHIALEDVGIRQGPSTPGKAVMKVAPALLTLATSLNLHTPASPDCTTKQLQSFLQLAAIDLVHRQESRTAICNWLMDAKLPTKGCDPPPPTAPQLDTACVKPPDERWLSYWQKEHATNR